MKFLRLLDGMNESFVDFHGPFEQNAGAFLKWTEISVADFGNVLPTRM